MTGGPSGGRGSTTPVTPAHSALRSSAPRLRGSVMPAATSKNGDVPCRPGQVRSSRETGSRGRASASTPWGASVRAWASRRARGTVSTGTLHSAGQLLDPVQLWGGVLVLGEHDPPHGPAPHRQQLDGAPALDLVPAQLAQGLGAGSATRTRFTSPVRCTRGRRGTSGSSGSPGLHQHDGQAGDPLGAAGARPGPRPTSP